MTGKYCTRKRILSTLLIGDIQPAISSCPPKTEVYILGPVASSDVWQWDHPQTLCEKLYDAVLKCIPMLAHRLQWSELPDPKNYRLTFAHLPSRIPRPQTRQTPSVHLLLPGQMMKSQAPVRQVCRP